jgi:class 3 adenylate cyclase
MRSDTPQNAIFVSCDIVGHAETDDHAAQLARIRRLNEAIKAICGEYFAKSAIWASGGDGGHVAFLDPALAPAAIRLLESLFAWAKGSPGDQAKPKVKLRLTGHYGPVAVIEGADGRSELVGDGINTCGSLLKFAEPGSVLVTTQFRDFVCDPIAAAHEWAGRLKFGAQRRIYLKHGRSAVIIPLSITGSFESQGDSLNHSDRMLLQEAVLAGESWLVIYHAKRLLQVNSSDADAIEALQSLTPSQLVVTGPVSTRMEAHPLLSQMNRQAVHDLVRGAQLVERDDGELICAQDDTGDAMFIIVKGRIGVSAIERSSTIESAPAPIDISFAPGQVVGELALALSRRRTASLQAVGPTAFLSISYATLRGLFEARAANPRLQRAFNEFLLDRSLRFLCANCDYLAKGENAPLAGVSQPWETMVEDSEYMNFDWHDAEAHLASNDRFASPGLYILAGGRLIEATQNEVVTKRLDGQDLPIVFVDLPNTLVISGHPYQIDPESGATVNVVRISDRALKAFGPTVYAKLISAIRRQLAQQFLYDVFISYSHHDEHIVANWRAAMERAGLRVYMSRPDAMKKFKPEIELAMAESLVMMPFVSDRAGGIDGQSGWVQREIEYRKSLFDEDHCNILPIELTPGLSGKFADGFSAVVISGDGSAAISEAIEAIGAVRKGTRLPPFATQRAGRPRI